MSSVFELSITRTIHAKRSELFEAWLQPETLKQFIRPGPNMSVPTAEVDARIGGKFLIVMRLGEQDLEHRGEYKEITRHSRLIFTWVSAMSVPDSTVTLDFKDVGENQTEITLHHVGFPNQESRSNHEGGWGRILDALSLYKS